MESLEVSRRSFLEKSLLTATGAGLALATAKCAAQPESSIIPTVLGSGEKLKIGIVGCGNFSQAHIRAMNEHEHIEIAALCDILPEMLEQKKKQVKRGTPRLFTDMDEMFKWDELHAVTITLPNPLHRRGTISALEAGKHVLCEKPMAMNVTDCKAMIAAGDKARRVLQISTESRHSPRIAEMVKQVHAGAIGKVLYAWVQTFRGDWRKIYPDAEEDSKKNWRMNQEICGGIIYEQGVHSIDYFNWLIDSEPMEIAALGGVHNSKLQKRDSLDHTGVLVRYANDVLMTYGGHLYSCGGPGPNCLFGDEGTLVADYREPKILKNTYWNPHGGRPNPDPLAETIELKMPETRTNVMVLEYSRYSDAIQGIKPPFPTGRDHLPALQILRGSLIAIAEKRVVPISEVT